MADHKSFSCIIFGEGVLPIQCAEILLERRHTICAIISADPSLHTWGDDRNIPYMIPRTGPLENKTTVSRHETYSQARNDLANFVQNFSFDYLFCIINYYTLPEALFHVPKKMVINYHDALLPTYGGFYVTSWAIMNGEKSHGVDWHAMNDVIDGGDILVQSPLEIRQDETAYSLNAKSFDAAIQSFKDLTDDLAFGRVKKKKQNPEERTFYPLYQRPNAGGIISWKHKAEEIDRLVRALNFGHYSNPLGLPLCKVGNEFVILNKLERVQAISNKDSGTIIKIASDFIEVAAEDFPVKIQQISDIFGQPLKIQEFVETFGLCEGDRFPEVETGILDRIFKRVSACAKDEYYWVTRLQTIQPIFVPFAESKNGNSEHPKQECWTFALPEKVMTNLDGVIDPSNRLSFFLSSFGVYLSRITGLTCFDLGFNNKDGLAELIELDNYFETVVPLKFELDSNPSFTDLVADIRDQIQFLRGKLTYAKHIFPRFEKLRSLGGKNLYPVVIEMVEGLDGDTALSSRAPLVLVVPSKLGELQWRYDPQVVQNEKIIELTSQFTNFLSGILGDRDQPVSEIPILDAKSLNKILVEFNTTKQDFPKAESLQQLFESQVERTPENIALVYEKKQLTYHELNQRSNRLANFLRRLDLGPEPLVGVYLERSLEMSVALLGVLKAGAAYVPLDPGYPKERLKFMIEDARLPVLLTQKDLVDSIPKNHACQIVDLDSDWERIEKEASQNLAYNGTLQTTAYMIYTSGSSGKPKGVLVPHSAICNHMLWMNTRFSIGDADIVFQKTPFSFDASVWEFYAPILTGAQLIMARPGGHQDSAYLAKTIAEKNITILQVVPSMLQLLVENPHFSDCKSLRIVFCGGEPLSIDLCTRFFSALPETDLCNLYGPTEACIDATYWLCPRDIKEIFIGQPVSNAQIYILDAHLNPVPVSVPGEIHIAGGGLAKGYLNRKDLTDQKFIDNPFNEKQGTKLYKTGDSGCWNSEGKIKFLGRIDHQIKIRGLRIELGEIESCLIEHESVKDSVVVLREDSPGDKRLIAYIIPEKGSSPNITDLRNFVMKRLPDYMSPSGLVLLDELPLLPNGKVNRQVLPKPGQTRPDIRTEYVAARTETEAALAGIWEEILGICPVGINDNFFDLGGHSLLAMRMLTMIEKRFNQKLPPLAPFQSPTVIELSPLVSSNEEVSLTSQIVQIQSSGTKPPFFFTGLGGGQYPRNLAKYLGVDQPFYALLTEELAGRKVNEEIVRDMAALYVNQVTSVQPNGPYYIAAFCGQGVVAFEMAHQLLDRGQDVAFLAMVEAPAPGKKKMCAYMQGKMYFHSKRLVKHSANLMKSSGKEKWEYITEMARSFQMRTKKNISRLCEKLYYKWNLSLGRPIPEELKESRAMRLEFKNVYTPKIYPGKITVFMGNQADYQYDKSMGWGKLSKKGAEVHVVSGQHTEMLKNENVIELAGKLKACLERIQP